MKKLTQLLFTLLILSAAKDLQAQQLPPVQRSNDNHVLTDNNLQAKKFLGLPRSTVIPASVPDSLRGGALRYSDSANRVEWFNKITGAWEGVTADTAFVSRRFKGLGTHESPLDINTDSSATPNNNALLARNTNGDLVLLGVIYSDSTNTITYDPVIIANHGIQLPDAPVSGTDAANKSYVDGRPIINLGTSNLTANANRTYDYSTHTLTIGGTNKPSVIANSTESKLYYDNGSGLVDNVSVDGSGTHISTSDGFFDFSKIDVGTKTVNITAGVYSAFITLERDSAIIIGTYDGGDPAHQGHGMKYGYDQSDYLKLNRLSVPTWGMVKDYADSVSAAGGGGSTGNADSLSHQPASYYAIATDLAAKQDALGFTPYNSTNPNGYINTTGGDARYPQLSGTYDDPAWLNTLAYSKLTGSPTNVSSFTNDAGYLADFSGKTTSDLTEGSNLYYTDARAISAPLTGYAAGSGTVSSSDDIRHALQKLDGNIAAKQDTITVTNTGASGVATLIGNVLNVPHYSVNGIGAVPTSRTLTINGTTLDLTANRTFTLGTDDVAEGSTNLYWTTGRGDARYPQLSGTYDDPAWLNTLAYSKLTGAPTNVSSFTNDAGYLASLSGKTTSDLAEGSNLYYTNARGIGSTLTGYVAGSGTVSSSDDILHALQKLDGNIADNTTAIGTKAAIGDDNTLNALHSLGSGILGWPIGTPVLQNGNNFLLTSGNIVFTAVQVVKGATISNVNFWLQTVGNYTSSGNNQVGLYSKSGGTLTLQASSTTSTTLYKGSNTAVTTVPLSSPYVATADVYYVALIYNSTSPVTDPRVYATVAAPGPNTQDFTNTYKLSFTASGTSLPSTIATTSMSGSSSIPFVTVK